MSIATGVAVAIALVGLTVRKQGRAPSTDATLAASADPRWRELETVLHELRTAWHPAARAELLRKHASAATRCEQPLRELLSRPDHALLREGIEVTEEWRVAAARAEVVALIATAPRELRARSVELADDLTPLPEDELVELLADAEPTVVVAALKLLARREHSAWDRVLEHLSHPDEGVRDAARAALAGTLPPSALRQVFALIHGSEPAIAAIAIGVLATASPSPEVESILTLQVGNDDPAIRRAALAALGEKSGALLDPAPVRQLAVDTWSTPIEQAHALSVLEKTDSFSPSDVRGALPSMHPVARYFAARCLLAAGDRDGVVEMLRVATSEPGEFDGIEPDTADAVRISATRILGDLTGSSARADPEIWRDWIEAHDSIERVALHAPPITFRN